MKTPMPNDAQLQIHIHCHTMPGRTFDRYQDVELGIQRGQDLVDSVAGDRPDPFFMAEFRVKYEASTGRPNFLGAYVHGTPNARFVYLSWSGVADGERTMFRRLKILLGSLSWEQVEQAVTEDRPLVVRVKMTDREGGPACGSARDNVEWDCAHGNLFI